MQLLLTLNELQVVVDVMEASGESHPALEEKIVARDLRFGFDELEDLLDLLQAAKGHLAASLAACKDPAEKDRLTKQRDTLEHALDKVTEATAMA